MQADLFSVPRPLYTPNGQLVMKNFSVTSVHELEGDYYTLFDIIDIDSSSQFTLKLIDKAKITNKTQTLSQINNQRKFLNDECIMKLLQIYQDDDNIYMLMEKNGKSLSEILLQRGNLSERQVQYIYCLLVQILHTLRKKNIFHGGICLENLYIHHAKHNMIQLKLSGFGSSINMEKIKDNNKLNSHSSIEPNFYTSPQLLEAAISQPKVFYSSDIWSMGVVLFNLLLGVQPFSGNHQGILAASINKIKNCSFTFPKMISLSTIWKQLLKKIFQPFNRRICLKQLIDHQFTAITQSMLSTLNLNFVQSLSNNWLATQDLNLECQHSVKFNGNLTENIQKLVDPKILESRQYDKMWQNNFRPIMQQNNTFQFKKSQISQNSVSKNFFTATNFENKDSNFKANSPEAVIIDFILNQDSRQLAKTPLTSTTKVIERQDEIMDSQHLKRMHKNSTVCLQKIYINREPQYLEQYCYVEKQECLGYLLSNNICVLFRDSTTIFGTTKNNFAYYSKIKKNGNLLEYVLDYQQTTEDDMESQSSQQSQLLELQAYRISFFEKKNNLALSKTKLKIYQYFVDFYGQRVVKETLNNCVIKFWRLQSTYIFLFSNGVWQVNLNQGKNKGEGAVLIDQNYLGWWFGPDGSNYNPLCIKVARDKIKKIKAIEKQKQLSFIQ